MDDPPVVGTLRRSPRADAARNRAAILGAARRLYDESGVDVSMDGVAVAAGVSNATLYRNFRTRDELLVELMRDGIDTLLADARHLAAESDGRDALAMWVQRLAWHLRTWHGMPARIVDALGDTVSPMRQACEPLQAETRRLVDAAAAAGGIPADTSPSELFELATLLSWGIDRYGDDPARARRRVTTAFAGLLGTA